jgi:hypothetical protein
MDGDVLSGARRPSLSVDRPRWETQRDRASALGLALQGFRRLQRRVQAVYGRTPPPDSTLTRTAPRRRSRPRQPVQQQGVRRLGLRPQDPDRAVENRVTFGGDWSQTTQEGVRDGTVPPAGETFPTSAFPRTDYTLAGVFVQDEIVLAGGALRIIPACGTTYDLSTDPTRSIPARAPTRARSHVSPKIGVVCGRHARIWAVRQLRRGLQGADAQPGEQLLLQPGLRLYLGAEPEPEPGDQPERRGSASACATSTSAVGKIGDPAGRLPSDYEGLHQPPGGVAAPAPGPIRWSISM